MKKPAFLTLLLAVILLSASGSKARAQAIRVSYLEGKAWVSSTVGPPPPKEYRLDNGQALQPGQVVRTGAGAKVELQISGMGILRLGASSVMRVPSTQTGGGDSASHAQATLISGNLWVNGRPGDHPAPIEIATASCVVETTGGVFRVTIYPDHTLEVKGYGGAIRVSGPETPRPATESSHSPASATAHPTAWKYELSLHTKIVVWPNGTATPPFRFVAKADETAWVQWNLQRDETAKGAP
jgi:hypothetical protein